MMRKITLIVAVISLVFAILFCFLFFYFENKSKITNKPENTFLEKRVELCFIIFLGFSSVFSLCFIYNVPFLFGKLWDFLKNFLGV